MSAEATTWSHLWEVVREETDGLHVRLLVANVAMSVLQPFVGNRLRVRLLRWAGVSIGTGTVVWGKITVVGTKSVGTRRTKGNLVVGEGCWINGGCYFDASAAIEIGDRVAIGQQVMIVTDGHDQGGSDRRAGDNRCRPVRVEEGAWLSTRCTVLPGVTVGRGAIVAAGAVVTTSVPAHTMVGGVPARLIRELDPSSQSSTVTA